METGLHILTTTNHRNTACPGQCPPKNKLFSILLYCFCFVLNLLVSRPVPAQSLPAGFTTVQITDNLPKPTAMAIAPDGRIFITQQDGVVNIVKNGVLLPEPFLTLPVYFGGERGLVGIVLDRDFSRNPYVYLYYTLADGSRNRISRFTANGDVVVPGSEKVILNLDPLSSATIHNGGAMRFAPDGKLFVAIGDNATPANAQNLDTYHGKLIRINPDGSVPAGNPFTGSAQKSRVWAYGLRNPFTFDIQQSTGRIYVNDVGQGSWEEVNDATVAGRNFGWPLAEGNGTNPGYTNPVYTYPHGAGNGKGCAITGGVFFNPATTNYPAEYWGDYFFHDYCNQWIDLINLSAGSTARHTFGSGLHEYIVYISVGPDGNLYYLERNIGALIKVIYTSNTSPVIVKQPASVSVPEGQPASFSVTVTGSAPLKYQWQKDGANIAHATGSTYNIPAAKASDAGTYRVLVSNAYGSTTSTGARLTVTAFNTPPQAKILTPAAGALYRGGDTLKFSGDATDAEDGSLPASAFSWSVDFHHDAHRHDGPPVVQGSKTGSFVVPTSGEVSDNVWYRLILVVTDSKGLKDTTYRDIHPHKSLITLKTQPAGLQAALDGQPLATPVSVKGVEGIVRTIGPVAPQTAGVKVYSFDRWLHGGAAVQTISTPQNDTALTAIYKESPFSSSVYEAESAKLSGAVASGIHSGYTGSGFADYINPSGDYIEWTVSVAAAGSYNLGFRYALAKAPRSLHIQVNGITLNANLTFPTTPAWNNWMYVNLAAHLKAGTNIIRATATGTSGPNLDHLLVSPQLLEAEYAQLSGAKIATNHTGYTGTGFVDYINKSGDYIEWIVYKNTAGNASLNFRYANGSAADRPLKLQVNGIEITAALNFPPTGSWTNWADATITANLSAGMNKVRLTATGLGGANIDHLKWSDAAAAAPKTMVQVQQERNWQMETGLRVSVAPNPASSFIRLQIERSSGLPVMVSIINAEGKVYTSLSISKGSSGTVSLPLHGFPAGLYLVVATQGSERASAKLVVE